MASESDHSNVDSDYSSDACSLSDEDPSVTDLLIHDIRKALLNDPKDIAAYVSIFCGETAYSPAQLPDVSLTDPELAPLCPSFSVAPPLGSWCPPSARTYIDQPVPAGPDPAAINVRGRLIATAYRHSSGKHITYSRFIVHVVILHQFAHAVASRFQRSATSVETAEFPYHHSTVADPDLPRHEHGFSVEESIFGGVIGVGFGNDRDGQPAKFFETDLTSIEYLVLYCRDGGVYKLEARDSEEYMNTHLHLGRFDVPRPDAGIGTREMKPASAVEPVGRSYLKTQAWS
ncbi:hypothetical protein FA95DRAFT_1606470 [Auriscalpium vulgare]|uniref:Uncharacterized protein n=1 Tax=Auriscalpium vulgare TaxID=40419 RepID=A0ACB8RT71_9AGAM|nr:hypothetical protein FA95DRAFT_1606470 [Auriscalpium vulgare]